MNRLYASGPASNDTGRIYAEAPMLTTGDCARSPGRRDGPTEPGAIGDLFLASHQRLTRPC
jgi:hypothetical protein